MKALTLVTLGLSGSALAPAARADAPAYNIIDLGVVGNAFASQAWGISPDGSVVVGRALGNSWLPYAWTAQGGLVALPNLSGRTNAAAWGANEIGLIVGTSATNEVGSNPLPVIWNHGAVSALPLPVGYTVGQAFSVNASGVAAGTVGAGFVQRAALFSTGGSSVITAATANGSYMTTALAINDAGMVVGTGVDPDNAAVSVGLVYDSRTGTLTSVGSLPGDDGALSFGVSHNGYVVGASTFEQTQDSAYIWSAVGGIAAVPLPTGADTASARGVNARGWVVGTGGGDFAVPYLYADDSTYTIQSLLPADSGWNLATNTSSSADAITDRGAIVGTGVHNGQVHAFEPVPVSSVPEPSTWALLPAGLMLCIGAARRRRRLA